VTIQQLCNEATLASASKGFHSPAPTKLEALMLIVSEIAEACEEIRAGKPIEYVENGKPEGLGVEMADAVIRIADFCGYHGINLQDIIARKMAFNQTREYKHGKLL
jgi:NTP pyrophosphatase (non-canonical NTP hydrolase)